MTFKRTKLLKQPCTCVILCTVHEIVLNYTMLFVLQCTHAMFSILQILEPLFAFVSQLTSFLGRMKLLLP